MGKVNTTYVVDMVEVDMVSFYFAERGWAQCAMGEKSVDHDG